MEITREELWKKHFRVQAKIILDVKNNIETLSKDLQSQLRESPERADEHYQKAQQEGQKILTEASGRWYKTLDKERTWDREARELEGEEKLKEKYKKLLSEQSQQTKNFDDRYSRLSPEEKLRQKEAYQKGRREGLQKQKEKREEIQKEAEEKGIELEQIKDKKEELES